MGLPKKLEIMPAYRRSYKTHAAARADWDAGKDFKICGGPYLSNKDVGALKAEGVEELQIFMSHKFVTYEVVKLGK